MPNCSLSSPLVQVNSRSALQVRQREAYPHGYALASANLRHATPSPVKPVQPGIPTQLQTDVSSRFGRRLRELRVAHGFTQDSMARKFGIDRSYISDIERGKKSIGLPTLEVIALGFKTNISDLMRDI